MNVKKIFITLITIVACVIIGAFLLNTMLPNVTKSLVNATEDMIFKASGVSFDFNGDGVKGSNNKDYDATKDTDENVANGAGVDGFN